MSKLQIALIILAVLSIFIVPLSTYFVSTSEPIDSHTEHDFSGAWKTDENSHWKTCSGEGCKEKADESAHIYGEGQITKPATEAEEGVTTYACIICGYEKTEPIAKIPHVHSYEEEYTNDETHHWHESACGHEPSEKVPHLFDEGFIVKPATDTENGIMAYTCVYCGYDYEEEYSAAAHKHFFDTEYSYDEDSHWYAALCGHDNVKGKAPHTLGAGVVTKQATEEEEGITSYACSECDYVKEEPIAKLPHKHVFDENGQCKCGIDHAVCEACNQCAKLGCTECDVQCEFVNTNYVIPFAPNAIALGAPEGPDGTAPAESGAYIYDESIKAEFAVADNGAHVTKVSLPNGTPGHSGISFLSHTSYVAAGSQGYNVNVPQYQSVPTTVRMYFTNTGSVAMTFKFSFIDYYYDKGATILTLAAGESKVVEFASTYDAKDVVGLNQQIVFLTKADAGASLTIWGEFVAGEAEYLSILGSADKLVFAVGEQFTAEGLILGMNLGTTDKKSNLYNRVYITDNYTTDLDGYTFTEEDASAGSKTVTVSFAGKTITYNIVVGDHVHDLALVPATAPVACTTDGTKAYYKCNAADCGKMYSDAQGFNAISEPEKISCHTAPTGDKAYPGTTVQCTKCSASMIAPVTENWVLFSLTTNLNTVGSNVKNPKFEHALINGIPGTKVTIGAGTVGATNDSAIHLNMTGNDAGHQTIIPNVSSDAADGTTRTIVLHYVNYSDVQITMNLQNDGGSSKGMCKVTVPANGTASGTFTMTHKQSGTNWFNYYVDFSTDKDVSFGVYGYIYFNDGETTGTAVNTASAKTVFKVGESFSTDGVVVTAKMNDTGARAIYAETGFTTNYDGKIFTAEDVGTHTVTVDFCGKTVTYTIEVEE